MKFSRSRMSASQLRAPEQLRVQTAEKAVNSFDGDKAERSFRVLAWFGRIVSFAGQSIAAVLVALAIYVGILSDLEGLAISMLLREWQTDVPSFVHALRIRRAGQA
mgnify:CR=1 FL=1